MSVQIFGIRHHGPGSARSLRAALDRLEPDVILVEGPPEAESILPLCGHPDLVPPVAILIHVPGKPRSGVFYPMASFSPEWHALRHGVERAVPTWLIDLPQANRLALEAAQTQSDTSAIAERDAADAEPRIDPLTHLARAAGFDDGERWWGRLVEERRDAGQVFDAVREAMTALRHELELPLEPIEARREAHMRHRIREAIQSGFQRIAVVCGAWHVPALADLTRTAEDGELLKGLPSVPVAATWVPWTHERLSLSSGYGAGVESPGWYHHLFTEPCDIESRWMARVARLLRDKDLDASPAHVIEAVRLAECLAAMRGRPLAGLAELNDAAESVLCLGNPRYLRLIHDRLIVGHELGAVPAETPQVPLQRDLEEKQKRLRLPARADEKLHDLDLRKETDLQRSRLLHCLALLGIDWGEEQRVTGKKGTFHEVWKLKWQPELAVRVIEASLWGATVEEACASKARNDARDAHELATLTRLLDRVLLADLSAVVPDIIQRIGDLSAATAAMLQLMDALPPLGNAMRYGNVRQTSLDLVTPVVDGLVARIAIGLPGSCSSLDDAAAEEMLSRLVRVHQTVQLLERAEHARLWREALEKLGKQESLHGLVGGRAIRLLLDSRSLSPSDAADSMRLALSRCMAPAAAAAWIEGFLRGSGLVLLHDADLWGLIDAWIQQLSPEHFLELVPLLRRTFTTFAAAERRQMGERARRGGDPHSPRSKQSDSASFDEERAREALPLIARLLGLEPPAGGEPRG